MLDICSSERPMILNLDMRLGRKAGAMRLFKSAIEHNY
jgi:hypothetical protein